MWHATLKDLAARKVRLVTTGVAVLLGVAFMAGTLVLTDTVSKTFDDLFADVYDGTDAVVRGEAAFSTAEGGDQRPKLDASMVDEVAGVDGVATAEGMVLGYAQIVDSDGDALGNLSTGAPTFGSTWIADDDLNPFDLVEGEAPEASATVAGVEATTAAPYEVVIDRGSAADGHLAVGDTTEVLTVAGPQPVTVVGIASFGEADNPGGASYAMFAGPDAEALVSEPGRVDAIGAVAEPGVSQDDLAERIDAAVPEGTEVLTGEEITAEAQSDVQESLGFFNTFLLSFAVIALFVGSFIIYNTFSILVAQRTKEMALLRALGAGRRQVLRAVLLEATLVGAIASALGLAAGIGVAAGLKALMAGMGIDVPASDLVVSQSTVVLSVVAGLGVTVASAVFPARRAAKVAPIAALRAVSVDTSAASRFRAVAGVVMTAVGALGIAVGLSGGDGAVQAVGLGAMLVFGGVAVLGPVIARPVSRVLGAPLPRLRGMAGTLARANAMRNPKRTSTTAAALMVGVALVSLITVLAASTKASIADTVDTVFQGEYVVDSGAFGSGGLDPELAPQLEALPEVDVAAGVRWNSAEVEGSTTDLVGIDTTRVEQLFDVDVQDGDLAGLPADGVALHQDYADELGVGVGDPVSLRFAETGEQRFTVGAVYAEREPAGDVVLGLPAYEANVAEQADLQVFVSTVDEVDPAEAEAAITSATDAHAQATVEDAGGFAESQAAEIDTIFNLVYALLALAVLIALIGIANTLALSIFERTRELGLLRAVGMSKAQVRSTIRWEAVIVALLGTTLGLAIGVAFGWAVVGALEAEGITTFTVPGASLVAVAVLAALAGVAAAQLPARRAARLDVLDAVAAD